MKDFNYIDQIVSDKLSNMTMPVEKTWESIEMKLNSTPQIHTPISKSFWSSLTFKIVGVVSFVAIGVVAFFTLDNTKNSNVKVIKPKEVVKFELNARSIIENSVVVNNTNENSNNDNILNTNNNQIADNNLNLNNIQKKDSIKNITIIETNIVEIDTIK